VNGYDALNTVASQFAAGLQKGAALTDFDLGEFKMPEAKIGELDVSAHEWLAQVHVVEPPPPPPVAPAAPPQSRRSPSQCRSRRRFCDCRAVGQGRR